MERRVIIVHRWGGTPDSDWYPWLKRMLAERGFEVLVPGMPNTAEPHISTWVPHLSKIAGSVDENTYFVGHSVGCQAIMRYAENLEENVELQRVVFVAPWLHLIEDSLESEEEKQLADEWTKTPINMQSVRKHMPRSFALFSDNDPYVPISDSKIFENELGSKVVIHPKRGHFTEDDGVTEVHAVLNELLKI